EWTGTTLQVLREAATAADADRFDGAREIPPGEFFIPDALLVPVGEIAPTVTVEIRCLARPLRPAEDAAQNPLVLELWCDQQGRGSREPSARCVAQAITDRITIALGTGESCDISPHQVLAAVAVDVECASIAAATGSRRRRRGIGERAETRRRAKHHPPAGVVERHKYVAKTILVVV